MLIVNLTTINSRLDLCSATVWSLIHQEMEPDIIRIWVSKEPYLSDDGVDKLPSWVGEINKIRNIVELKFTKNTGPYRKIIPALREASDSDVLVYADDDVIYGRGWLKNLVNEYISNSQEFVVAPRVRLMTKNIFGIYKSYSSYKVLLRKEILNKEYIITGVGGCILSRSKIKEELITLDDYMEIAPKTDDIWLSKLFQQSGVKLITAPEIISDVQEIKHSNFSLTSINTSFNKHYGVCGLVFKMFVKVKSYFGLESTNNDISIKKVNKFFDDNIS